MNMFDWYKKVVFENYANFSGRARRSEYWYFALCNFLISMILYIPLIATGALSGNEEPDTSFFLFCGLLVLYSLAIMIPSLAVAVRRLHDIGKSGWYYLVSLIPLVGGIILLVWFFTEGDPGSNQWGPNPKDSNNDISKIGNNE